MTIWGPTATPATAADPDASAVELGVKFTSDVNGLITGIRFYKSTTNTGRHTGTLWSSTGARLSTATFSKETASGWQQVSFATPVAITANTVYVASYHTNVGHYAGDNNYFAAAGVDKPPLHALRDGVSGGDGVYVYGASGFPTNTYRSSNYWVDIVFSTTQPAMATASATATLRATATNSPQPTGTQSQKGTKTSTATRTATPRVTSTARLTATSVQTATASATFAPSPTATPTSTRFPTATATPTATQVPTASTTN